MDWKIEKIGFDSYGLEIRIIILEEAKKKYQQINIIIMTTKMIVYSKWNSTSKLHLIQVKLVMKDLFIIEKYWAESNDKLAMVLGVWDPIWWND